MSDTRWVRAARQMTAFIDRGEVKPGDPLPSRRLLAERLGVGVTAIARAQDELAARGIVHRMPGGACFVSEPADADADEPVAAQRQQQDAGQPESPVFMTVRECATEGRLSVMTIYRLVEDGVIEHTRIGRSYRIYRDSWLVYLNAGRQ